jgi:hypothetical protein
MMVHKIKYFEEDIEDVERGILSYTSFSPFKRKFKKGDLIKVVVPFKGFKMYGIKKGSIGKIIRKSIYRGQPSYEVEFSKAGKQLSMQPHEIKKVD